MNAISMITMSTYILLLLGSSQIHGLTTFGKTAYRPFVVKAKTCTQQKDCTFIKNTTCLKGVCLCGDNHPPNNGDCSALLQGPNHICTKNDDCVDNADCFSVKELKLSRELQHLAIGPEISICRCQEGYTELGATCGDAWSTTKISMETTTIPFEYRHNFKSNRRLSAETDETEALDNSKLSRLLLLEQLKLIRQQQSIFGKKIKIEGTIEF